MKIIEPRASVVLLVDDDPGDVLMTKEAFAAGAPDNVLCVVNDGVEAMAYLRGESEFAGAERPDLVLLDLNLPRKGGREVLAEVKTDDVLRSIPIVILSTSDAQDDIIASYRLHANAYVTKPVDFDEYIRAVRHIDEFFLTIAQLPER